jgi:hypothetical protein
VEHMKPFHRILSCYGFSSSFFKRLVQPRRNISGVWQSVQCTFDSKRDMRRNWSKTNWITNVSRRVSLTLHMA